MKDLPYEVYISKENHRAAEVWCREKFGPRWSALDNKQGIWCVFWAGTRSKNPGSYRYYFLNEQDYLMFILKWI